jgi:hypothetical protein
MDLSTFLHRPPGERNGVLEKGSVGVLEISQKKTKDKGMVLYVPFLVCLTTSILQYSITPIARLLSLCAFAVNADNFR